MNSANTARIDIIIPVYNEGSAIEEFYQKLAAAIKGCPYDFRFIFVNDGSTDGTEESLVKLENTDPSVIVIHLSRNFGHQAALTAGIDLSEADAVITIDGDGQQPPEMIPEMLRLYSQGYDVVATKRIASEEGSVLKRVSSRSFYRFINWIGEIRIEYGSADFRLISNQVVRVLQQMPEYHRFIRGMVAWSGFRSVILPYEAAPRISGKSKYSLSKMLQLAADAIFSFSLVPLKIGVLLGLFFFFIAFIEFIYVLSFWVRGKEELLTPGWSSLMFMVLIVGGLLLFFLGVIGMYVGYIFQQVKERPKYIVRAPRQTQQRDKTDGSSE